MSKPKYDKELLQTMRDMMVKRIMFEETNRQAKHHCSEYLHGELYRMHNNVGELKKPIGNIKQDLVTVFNNLLKRY